MGIFYNIHMAQTGHIVKESDLNNKVKYLLIVIIGIFIVLQFIPVDRDNPAINENLELKHYQHGLLPYHEDLLHP